MHRSVLYGRPEWCGRPHTAEARPSRSCAIDMVLTLLPDSRDRLKSIYPYKTAQDALHQDGQRIAQDFLAVLSRRSPASHGQ